VTETLTIAVLGDPNDPGRRLPYPEDFDVPWANRRTLTVKVLVQSSFGPSSCEPSPSA
jgi:hypothetical protein